MYSLKVHHWVFLVHFQYHAFEMYFGLDCISLISPQQVLFWSSFLIIILALVYPFYCFDIHQLKSLQDVPTYFVLGFQLRLLRSEIKLLFNPKMFKNANGVSKKYENYFCGICHSRHFDIKYNNSYVILRWVCFSLFFKI